MVAFIRDFDWSNLINSVKSSSNSISDANSNTTSEVFKWGRISRIHFELDTLNPNYEYLFIQTGIFMIRISNIFDSNEKSFVRFGDIFKPK